MTENTAPATMLQMGKNCEVTAFMTGPDDMFLGLQFIDSEGQKVLINFAGPKGLNDLFAAMGNAQNMTLVRNMNVFSTIHNEVGCQRSHEIMAESLKELVDHSTVEVAVEDNGDAAPTKPNLTIVKH